MNLPAHEAGLAGHLPVNFYTSEQAQSLHKIEDHGHLFSILPLSMKNSSKESACHFVYLENDRLDMSWHYNCFVALIIGR
jgi:hypothetical protein